MERKSWLAIVLPLWVLGSFILSEAVVIFGIQALRWLGVSFDAINPAILNTVGGGLIYLLTILMVIVLPWKVKKYVTTRQELGLDTQPAWYDYLLAPAGFVMYVVLSALLLFIVSHLFTFIDLNQAQDTGFNHLTHPFEYILAFLMLVVIAPVSEEILFRGYLLGKLRQHVPTWGAILITSLLFGLIHFNWSVSIDVFALSIILCLLRIYTKRLWPSMFLHMIKNALAFYILFVNPTLLSTLGG